MMFTTTDRSAAMFQEGRKPAQGLRRRKPGAAENPIRRETRARERPVAAAQPATMLLQLIVR